MSWTPAPGPRRPLANLLRALRRSFQFRGRASRAEFWWFQAFYLGFLVLLIGVDSWRVTDYVKPARQGLDVLLNTFDTYPLTSIVELLLLPTTVAILWRRLNDIGWPGVLSLSLMLSTLVGYFIVPNDELAGFVSRNSDDFDQSYWELVFGRITSDVGGFYLFYVALDLVFLVFWIVTGLRRSRPENRHGPHPYLGPTGDVFR